MVRRNLTPKDKSELMTKNNYQAMTYILENRNSAFDINFILKIHQIITQDTLDDPEYVGKFRDEEVFIWDKANTVIFKPMPAEKNRTLFEQPGYLGKYSIRRRFHSPGYQGLHYTFLLGLCASFF